MADHSHFRRIPSVFGRVLHQRNAVNFTTLDRLWHGRVGSGAQAGLLPVVKIRATLALRKSEAAADIEMPRSESVVDDAGLKVCEEADPGG